MSALPEIKWMRNHRSAEEVGHEIHDQLLQLEEEGLVEWHYNGEPQEFARNVNPFGAVRKPNGDVRILVDPTITGVNECMIHLPLTLPSPLDALLATSAHTIMGKRDLSRGFYHMVLHPDSRPFMGFRDPLTHRLGRWVGLPLGAA